MKQSPRHLSDVDTHGRVRREHVEPDHRPLVRAKFLDGPISGQERMVPKGADYVRVGAWTYSWAGKENKVTLYCKLPKQRKVRAFLLFVIAKRGSDPRVDVAAQRARPEKRTTLPKRGQGARRRAEKRAANVA
jgi:hypothetical protein